MSVVFRMQLEVVLVQSRVSSRFSPGIHGFASHKKWVMFVVAGMNFLLSSESYV